MIFYHDSSDEIFAIAMEPICFFVQSAGLTPLYDDWSGDLVLHASINVEQTLKYC